MVYLFLAEGFEEIEALTPFDILKRGKVEVKTVGVGSKSIKGSHGITVLADMEISEMDYNSFDSLDAVILPGGMPGTINLENSSAVKDAVKYCYDNDKIICAICAAPSIFGHMDMLKDIEATAFPSFQEELKGAKLSEKYVVRDENIITARGMGVSVDFGLEILSALKDEKTAADIKSSIQCKI